MFFFGSEMIPLQRGSHGGELEQDTGFCNYGSRLLGVLKAQRGRSSRHLHHLASYTRLLDTCTEHQALMELGHYQSKPRRDHDADIGS